MVLWSIYFLIYHNVNTRMRTKSKDPWAFGSCAFSISVLTFSKCSTLLMMSSVSASETG